MTDDFKKSIYAKYVSTSSLGDIHWDEQRYQFYYENYFRFVYQPIVNRLPRNSRVLEIGCGAGMFLFSLAKANFVNTEGIDLSAEQVNIARQMHLPVTQNDVITKLATPERYDIVVAIDIIEHFDKNNALELLRHIRQSLNPNGMLILQTVNGAGLFPRQIIYDDLTHSTVFTPQSLTQALRLAGFNQFEFYESGPVAAGRWGPVRKILWRLVTWLANAVRFIETGKTQKLWSENMICVAR